jgi:serpin B
MKRVIAVCCILVLVVGCGQSSEVESTLSFDDEIVTLGDSGMGELGDKIAPPISELGLEMVRRMLELDTEKNLLFSPLSLSIALEMLQNGAEGETKAQILNVIGKKNEAKDASSEVVNSIND